MMAKGAIFQEQADMEQSKLTALFEKALPQNECRLKVLKTESHSYYHTYASGHNSSMCGCAGDTTQTQEN